MSGLDPNLIESLRVSAQTALATAQACLQIVSELQRQQQEDQWVPLDDAAAQMGPGISPEMLKERCIDGRFKYGVHFINTSDGRRGNYLVKLAAVRKFFETDPAKRPLPRKSA